MSTKALLLAAGYGQRLNPFTKVLPKCLMPINKKPILEFWIERLISCGIENILINVHHFPDDVINFLNRERFREVVVWVKEDELLGTAGTLKANMEFFRGSDILFVHADNFCLANLDSFIKCHKNKSSECIMTMMTFLSENPESCGIVTTDNQGIVTEFFEKVNHPPSNLANAAIYLLDQNFLYWLQDRENVFDFSLDVIPNLLGRIMTWNNENVHIDIGTIENLIKAQNYGKSQNESIFRPVNDDWYLNYLQNPIHKMLENEQIVDEKRR